MKNKFFAIVALSLFLISTFTSCKKENNNSTLPNSNPSSTSNFLRENNWQNLCDVENSNNIFDSAGFHHNRIVSICEDAAHSDMSENEVYQLTDSILNLEYSGQLISGFSSENYASPILDSFTSESSIRNYINSLSTTTLQKDELNKLLDLMLAYDGTNLCDVIDNIKSFEDNLLSQHSSSDLQAVLIASSVGRYSLAYWHNRLVDDGTGQKTTAFWKKFFIGVCDGIGAAGGALAGSATVVGGIAGGVVGGIAASNGAATLWNQFAN